jgi:hypothetical protein
MMLVEHVTAPPPPLIHRTRITSHSSLSDIVKVFNAPDVKTQTKMKPVQTWETHARTKYYVSRMKVHAKSALSPDMNLTLKEIQTGERIVDKIIMSLFVYTVGAFFVLFLRS